ncbi:MAG TPA: hypothetical protein VE091_07330 [Gemmatimonadales bacterium]|nr:hypothetical protein [Gemmatimonadales bacterium]
MVPEIPSRDGDATATCPVCRGGFVPAANKVYCSQACRATAWRRRHQASVPAIAVPPALPRRPLTVYECEACGIRSLGDQRCEECGSFMRRVGRRPQAARLATPAQLVLWELLPAGEPGPGTGPRPVALTSPAGCARPRAPPGYWNNATPDSAAGPRP